MVWEFIATYVNENFDKVYFSVITLIVLTCALLDFRDKNYPPGPMGLPFFGYLPMLNFEAPYLTLNELAQQYGRVFSVQFGSVYTVILADIKLMKEALASDVFSGRPPLFSTKNGTMKTYGQTDAEATRWRDHRRFVSSIFKDIRNPTNEKSVLELRIAQGAKDLVQDLRPTAGNGVDLDPILRHGVGSVLASLILGTRFDKTNADWQTIQRTFDLGREVSSVTGTLNYVPWFRRFVKNEALSSFQQGLKETHQIFEDLMSKQAKTVNASNVASILDAYVIELKRRQGRSGDDVFTKEEVYQVLSDIIGVGWESAMTSLKWLFLYMAIYPDVQEKVCGEINKLKRRNGVIGPEDMKELPYIEATIMETFRHAGILPLGIPHETQKYRKLGDYHIPKGSLIVPLFWAVNQDGRLWEKPNVFSPERFLNEDGTLRPNDNLIQTGNSMCIGEDLSRPVVRIFFTTVMNNFNIFLGKGVNYCPEDLPKCGMMLVPKFTELQLEARH